MLPEIVQFNKWLRRKRPHTSTHWHYTNDLKLFFDWSGVPPGLITLRDIDRYIERCQGLGHVPATVNRRLAAISAFYEFLQFERDDAPPNPVLSKRHYIPQGQRLPRDAQDADVEKLFAVMHDRRDRAMFLLMLRCGLRVGSPQFVYGRSLPQAVIRQFTTPLGAWQTWRTARRLPLSPGPGRAQRLVGDPPRC